MKDDELKDKKLRESRERQRDQVGEAASAFTYGMSAALRNSDLLWRIDDLDYNDKSCLIRYLQNAISNGDDSQEDQLAFVQIGPKTPEEAVIRAQEAIERYERGEYLTDEEAKTQLFEEMPWLK